MSVVDQPLRKKETGALQLALIPGAATEKLRVPVKIYTPRCLMPALLTGTHSPHIAWSILWNLAKKMHISEAYMTLWAWIWVRLITDYVG